MNVLLNLRLRRVFPAHFVSQSLLKLLQTKHCTVPGKIKGSVSRMIILGIDPGYAIVGYGVIKYENSRYVTLDYGAVTTPAKTAFTARLEQIYDGVSEIAARWKPQAMAVEELFFNSNTKTAIDVAQARGVILLAATKCGVPVFEYTPLQVKQSVVGYGRAEKKQVMEMTRMLLGLSKVPKPDDTADALAMAICHANSSGSLMSAALGACSR
jgi:crossover junction endodeoxyribonuclease RuvC